MSLAKIPLVLCFSFAFKRCITSPNPAAADSEKVSKKTLNKSWYTQQVAKYATLMQFFAGLSETALILAANYPDAVMSKLALRLFLFKGGNVSNLRLSPFTLLGVFMMIIGTLIRVVTYRYLGKFFRFEASIQADHQLVTGGPYSVVRHPSYTGLLITHPGWFLWQFGGGSWVLESGLWNLLLGKLIVSGFALLVIIGTLNLTLGRMNDEDKALKARFGAEWEQWARRVPCQVMPGIY